MYCIVNDKRVKRKESAPMIWSLLKIFYFFVQLLICVLLILEKLQPIFLPSAAYRYGLPPAHFLLKQDRRFWAHPEPRPRPLSWRRLLFLLG